MSTKQTFNEEAEDYEFTSRAVNIYFDECLQNLLKRIKVKTSTPKILDLCCGTGILTEQLFKKFPSAQIVGVDFSSGMLNVAKRRLKGKNFVCLNSDICNTKKMQTLPNDFDLVISSFGIHNVHDKQQKLLAINNCIGLLKPGGQFITCDYFAGKNQKEQTYFNNFQKQWLLKTYTLQETQNWLDLLAQEDQPETLKTNLQMLKAVGLKKVKCLWKKVYIAIWQAIK